MFRKKYRFICIVLVLISTLTGCNRDISSISDFKSIEEVLNNEAEKKEITKLEPIELEAPTSRVKVLIDRVGYDTGDDKTVFFVDALEGNTFKVIDMNSKEIVYEGIIEKNGDICVGDFSDIETEGVYQLETDNIGFSYELNICNDIWEKMMWETLEKTEAQSIEDGSEKTTEAAVSIHTLLFALQCYPEVFEQDNTMITWLLKTADTILNRQSENGSFYDDYKTTAICSGVMLMCADQFEKYDYQISKSFEKSSKKGFEYMVLNEKDKNEDALFYYMCQSFHRNNAQAIYKTEIEEYINKNAGKITTNLYSFLGSVIYINSERNTDRDTCTLVMQNIVAKTEDISEAVKSYPFLVNPESNEKVLEELLLICFIDYITPSREYMDIIKNTMHYLNGANVNNEIIIHNSSDWNIFWSSIILFCLADINN